MVGIWGQTLNPRARSEDWRSNVPVLREEDHRSVARPRPLGFGEDPIGRGLAGAGLGWAQPARFYFILVGIF